MVKARKFIQATEGTIMVLTAVGLVAFLGFASLAIDMGHLYVVRNELQNVADAAALAGANQLIVEQDGEAVRDSAAAQQAVMDVAQTQAQLVGLPLVDPGSRNDLTIALGNWNIYAGNTQTAWTDSDGSPYSNANAVRVSIRRASGVTFGPVTNFLAGILGHSTSEVAATATAYLGFVESTPPGAVDIPLAIPDTVITAANPGNKSWWARILGPSEAMAGAPSLLTFKDLGSDNFYSGNLTKPLLDPQKAYLVTINDNDPVPDTVNNNLIRQANPNSGTPVRALKRGDRLYPLSEYQWASNISTIFSNFKQAYDANKDGSGKYRAVVPVYSSTQPMSRLQRGVKFMAGLFAFGPHPACACFEFGHQSYPDANRNIWVEGITTVSITDVTYKAVATKKSQLPSRCDDCSPYSAALDGTRYSSTVDCMVNNPNSCRNLNSLTVEIPSGSTVSNPGTSSGGPDNYHINPAGSAGRGSFAKRAKLVE
jgi:Flp pilus assembly protein TadG